MKIKITLVFLFLSVAIFAQKKYRVVYDYKTENISYYELKNNKIIDTLSNPKIRRNSLIELNLKNVNPFAVDAVVEFQEEKDVVQSGQGFNFSSLLGRINSFSGDNLGLNIENLPDSTGIRGFGITSRSTNANTTSNKVKIFNTSTTNIAALKRTMMSNLINPNLYKQKIIDTIINTAYVIADERIKIHPKDNFYLFLLEIEKYLQEDKVDLSDDILIFTDEIENTSDTQTILSRGEITKQNIALNNMQKILQEINNSTDQALEDLNTIKSLYTMLEASSFEKNYDYELDADKVIVRLKFVQSNFSNNEDSDTEKSTLKIRKVKLLAKGGFKINTSVAFTLNNFGSKSKDFFKKEGVIGADINDRFVPNLSTMINFYPYAGESFNVGGSFGLSIPISGTEDISRINFLLGPTLFFGSKSRLSLSGGIVYGPVNVLKNGFEVGDDAPEQDISNFIKVVYDVGYYFGISFSLFSVN